jgi:general stress protein YciG
MSKPRGFAGMKDRKRLHEIAVMGGKAVHAKGTGHEFTSEEARLAGRKGGQATAKKLAWSAKMDQALREEERVG